MLSVEQRWKILVRYLWGNDICYPNLFRLDCYEMGFALVVRGMYQLDFDIGWFSSSVPYGGQSVFLPKKWPDGRYYIQLDPGNVRMRRCIARETLYDIYYLLLIWE